MSWLSTPEEGLWCLLALVAVFLSLAPGHQPWYAADSYQYLSIAHNIAASGRIATSIVHFDVERHRGVIPAPSTTFPPGYPALIAAVERFGVPGDWSGLGISILSFVAMVPVLIRFGRHTGISRAMCRALLLLFLLNSEVAHAAASIATEMSFTLASTGSLALIALGMRHRPRLFCWGMTLAGVSYHLRYAGLFLVLTLALFAAALALARYIPYPRAATGVGLMLAIVAAGMLRNALVSGTWRGGNEKHMANGIGAILKAFVTSLYHLLFGEGRPANVWWFVLSAVAGLLLLGAVAYKARASMTVMPGRAAIDVNSLLLLTYTAIYSAGMVYLGVTSVVSFGTRLFIPLVPVLLLLVCHSLQPITRLRMSVPWTWTRILAFLGLGIAYAGQNLVSAHTYHPEAPHAIVERELDESVFGPSAAKVSMRDWIEEHVPNGEILIAADGQPTAYVLRRNTVSVLGRWFSTERWDAGFLHRLMKQYRARHLLLYTDALGGEPDEEKDWPLFQSLLRDHVPPWLKLDAQSRAAELFECTDCAAAGFAP